ncbi:MAG: hypothetical protein IKL52_02710 [Candidatus Gastranaerophilales bacterium]|jgi:hypothetical protein|nr:hypothetical protein [Candidatus Gastranaerophilales bacterium]
MKKLFNLLIACLMLCNLSFAQSTQEISEKLYKQYKNVTEDANLIRALEMLDNTTGKYSKEAILGKNLTNRPIKIEFLNLATINPMYMNFDALGWKKKKNLYIYINEKHKDAPIEALSAILAHEAIHQDEHNSLNEETYAWTLEAAVWTQLSDDNPELEKISHPLVERENVIKKLFIRGNYTSKYIHKFVVTNKGYQNLPERSYGFEELL